MPSAAGQLAHRHGLALAVGEGPGGAAGVAPVDDLRARAERAVEAQHVGQHLGHLLRGRRADVDGAPRVLVGVGHLEHLRVQARQHAGQHLRAPGAAGRPRAGREIISPTSRRTRSVAWSVEPRRRNLTFSQRVARDPPAGEQARAARRARPVQAGRAGHQRAVEVEERGAAPVLGRDVGDLLLRGDVVRHAPSRAPSGSRRRPGRRRCRSRRSPGRRRAGAARARARRGSARPRRRSGGRGRRRRR